MTEEIDKSASSQGQYLKDVFLCSLVAFGGPEAHLGVFHERLVAKKNYLSEKALMEWMALCSFLPGPTSTQVITGIGLERGGQASAAWRSFAQRYAPGKVIPRICWYNHSPSTASPRPGFPVKMASSA